MDKNIEQKKSAKLDEHAGAFRFCKMATERVLDESSSLKLNSR